MLYSLFPDQVRVKRTDPPQWHTPSVQISPVLQVTEAHLSAFPAVGETLVGEALVGETLVGEWLVGWVEVGACDDGAMVDTTGA